MLIQDIKDLLFQSNVTLSHSLREGNQCADFLAKLEASPIFLGMTRLEPSSLENDFCFIFCFCFSFSFFLVLINLVTRKGGSVFYVGVI
jgi:hypothetical protein